MATVLLALALLLNVHTSTGFKNSGTMLNKLALSPITQKSVCWKGQFSANRKMTSKLCDISMVASVSPSLPVTSTLQKAFKKQSGALSVAVQYLPSKPMDEISVQRLSLELRRQKAGVIFAESDAAIFAAEQMKAKGNFPGPVPIVTCSAITSQDDVLAAKTYGTSGFLLKPWAPNDGSAGTISLENAQKLSDFAAQKGVDAIWHVHTAEQLDAAVEAGALILLLDCAGGVAEATTLRSRIPKDRVAIVKVEAMQAGNHEVEEGSELRTAGFHGVLLSDACVGDDEDGEYVKWAVASLSSKASKEFKITGMTGHVNGHYGTGTFERSTAERQWRRRGASLWAPASTNAAGRKSASPP